MKALAIAAATIVAGLATSASAQYYERGYQDIVATVMPRRATRNASIPAPATTSACVPAKSRTTSISATAA